MKIFCSCQMLRNCLTTDTKVLYPNSKYNKKYGNALAHKISFHFSVDTLISTETLILYSFFANGNIKKAGYVIKTADIFNTALTAQSAKNKKGMIHLSFYSTWDT